VNAARYARVKELFLKACDLDEQQRGAFLQRECGGDAELHAEVQSLLKHHHPQTLLGPTRPGAGGVAELGVLRPHAVTVDASMRVDALAAALFVRKRHRYLTVMLLVLFLVGLAVWAHTMVRRSLRYTVGEQLQATLNADLEALDLWIKGEMSETRRWADRSDVRQSVVQLVQIGKTSRNPREDLLASTALADLQEALHDYRLEEGSAGYAIIDRSGLVLAAGLESNIGLSLNARGRTAVARVFDGETIFSEPHFQDGFADNQKVLHRGPIVSFHTPVRDEHDAIIASLSLGQRADTQFTRILSVARMGASGETYAFNADGLMLSESRFEEQLKTAGLIPDVPDVQSSLAVQIRDPGGDLTSGHKPALPQAAWPLTKMVRMARARAGENGTDLNGYRDYRGVRVIGAWRWLGEYDFGVASEVDLAEADAPLSYLMTAFWICFCLLAGATAGALVYAVRTGRLKGQVGALQQFGQYILEQKIGEGGMGIVYRARHAMLARPTAVKTIKPEHVSDVTIARFEREVQLASQLTHPNTIEIYDFGRTPDGIFYYAMEFVSGLSLKQLIAMEGAMPSPRVIYILRQVCGSLKEAHALGLIHRDIKPGNIMLCQRAGDFDVVKVVDFGLAKNVERPATRELTAPETIAGTPLYIAPERLRGSDEVDGRCDLYSVGAVGYKLLTGKDVFEGAGDTEILIQAVNSPPPRPSEGIERDIPRDLDQLIVDCLAKDPNGRPDDAAAVIRILDKLQEPDPWSQEDARRCWSRHHADGMLERSP
jgi:hypothetical protein